MNSLLTGGCVLLSAGLLTAEEYPHVEISNGQIRAGVYLPDPIRGAYRSTRFEWSGIIYSLQFKGHEYFGRWYSHHDPMIHDSITGPAEESSIAGMPDCRPGIGVLRHTGTPPRSEIIDTGHWNIHAGKDHVTMEHLLNGSGGCAWEYSKTIRLTRGRPELVLVHSLRNTGRLPIQVLQYDHNFFVIDGRPAGPDFVLRFPFKLRALRPLKDLIQLDGGDLSYRRELLEGEDIYTELEGFGSDSREYDIRLENRAAGAGVRIRSDHPMAKLAFWTRRTVVCPEPYLRITIPPGRRREWTIRYLFYPIPPSPDSSSR